MRTAEEQHFDVLASTVMPDHVHLLVHWRRDDADLRRFITIVRQRSSLGRASARQPRLWQDGYFEHVLRADEDVVALVRYIANNPVRAGLVDDARNWPDSGGRLLEMLLERRH